MDDGQGQMLSGRTTTPSPHFRHRRVADSLQRWVCNGEFAAGAKLPPLREIADKLRVSTTTVRRALRTLEKEGHVYQISGVGAFVRPTHRLKGIKLIIAFAAADLSSPLEMGIAQGIQKACHQRGWGVQLFDAHFDAEGEMHNLQCVPECGSRGAIVLPTCDPQYIDTLFRVQATGFPLVLVDRACPGLNASVVQSDHEKGAYLATRHLLDKGHRRVLMLAPPPRLLTMTARIRGYERALAEAGISAAPEWKVWIDPASTAEGIEHQKKWLGGYKGILPLLKSLEPPVAVLAMRDHLGWGVYEACRELQLRVPQDVSIVGFDDSDISRAMLPPMTVVAQRTEQIGRRAVELLEQETESPRRQGGSDRVLSHVLIDVDLIERHSVAAVSGHA